MPTPHQILKIIIFLNLKDVIALARDSIRLQLVHHKYQEVQARKAVQLYYILLADVDKDRLYKEFKKPNLEIRILVSSNALIYGTNISDIKYAVQYYIYKDKHINIIQQRFGYAAHSNSQTDKAIFLIKDRYKGLYKDITRPAKNCSYTSKAFRSQPS